MFTLEQIKAAHSKVKSGADFPAYIQELISLGVIGYETYVTDGHTDFYGNNDYKISSPRREASLKIADSSDAEQFIADLKAHQQGKTDYKTFCDDCAKSGIEKWKVSMKKMTCTYYDKDGEAVLKEAIPTA
jgi:uncharacterized protein YbcV (DUF1398 family)